jgi:hypothetical protein
MFLWNTNIEIYETIYMTFHHPFGKYFNFFIFRVFLNKFRHFRVVLISALLLCYKKFKHRVSNLYERHNFLCFSRLLGYIWRSQRLKRVNFQHLVDVCYYVSDSGEKCTWQINWKNAIIKSVLRLIYIKILLVSSICFSL